MIDLQMENPADVPAPLGPYSHVARLKNHQELLFIAGQLPVDSEGQVVGANDFDRQCEQVYANIGSILRGLGADFSNVVQFTTYITDDDYIPLIRGWRRREFPKFFADGAFPPNTLLVVDALADDTFMIEVAAIAAI
jgi:enamine deaminase RidA (YjgF/YER057c/UK114 family)